MASHSSPTSSSKPANLLSRLVSARVDFVMLGERTSPLTIVPAPYARNIERLSRIRAELGPEAAQLVVITELSSDYQELLYEALPRELYGILRIQVVPDEVVAARRSTGSPEIRVARSAQTPAR